MLSEHQISLLARVAPSGYQPTVFTIACSPTTPQHHPRTRIWSLRIHSRETGMFVAKNAPETHRTLHTNSRASCSLTTRLRLHRLGLPTTSRTDFVPFGPAYPSVTLQPSSIFGAVSRKTISCIYWSHLILRLVLNWLSTSVPLSPVPCGSGLPER